MPPFRDYRSVSLFALIVGIAVAGCAPTRSLPPFPSPASSAVSLPSLDEFEPSIEIDGAPTPRGTLMAAEVAVLTRLSAAQQDWDGTPYLFGGTTRDGADCSGFVQQVYREFFGMRLTRATATQVREGREVAPDKLQPGDLVFFRTGVNQRHVGIYLHSGHFLHASSRRGVTVDALTGGFYERTFWTARRVIPDRMLPDLAASTSLPPDEAARIGPVPAQRPSPFDALGAPSGPSEQLSETGRERVSW